MSPPVTSSHMRIPKEKTSHLWSYFWCEITSGAIHRYVPVSAVIAFPSVALTLATPKSATFTTSYSSISKFAVFRSRWMTFTLCR